MSSTRADRLRKKRLAGGSRRAPAREALGIGRRGLYRRARARPGRVIRRRAARAREVSPVSESSSPEIERIAEALRPTFIDRPFGALRFWRFAVVRPGDQSYVLVAVHADGPRLELALVHASRRGRPSALVIDRPTGLTRAADGITLDGAARLSYGGCEAWVDGAEYVIRTARGEGRFSIDGAPALTLAG